jgi:energy-coupling factor transporter ATP-binding protein EcfA2
MAEGKALLEVDDVTIRFGGLTALDSVSFDIREGEILGLIGPNGAGKTTCFNVMTGVYQATSGQVRFDGTPLAKMKRHKITKLGIARTFQNIRLFKSMTVLGAAGRRGRTGAVRRGGGGSAVPRRGTPVAGGRPGLGLDPPDLRVNPPACTLVNDRSGARK